MGERVEWRRREWERHSRAVEWSLWEARTKATVRGVRTGERVRVEVRREVRDMLLLPWRFAEEVCVVVVVVVVREATGMRLEGVLSDVEAATLSRVKTVGWTTMKGTVATLVTVWSRAAGRGRVSERGTGKERRELAERVTVRRVGAERTGGVMEGVGRGTERVVGEGKGAGTLAYEV